MICQESDGCIGDSVRTFETTLLHVNTTINLGARKKDFFQYRL